MLERCCCQKGVEERGNHCSSPAAEPRTPGQTRSRLRSLGSSLRRHSYPPPDHHQVFRPPKQTTPLLPPSSPELALGADIVLGPQLHAVHRGLGILLRGQVAAHHLVLVVLENSLHTNTTSGVLRPRHLLLLASPPGAMAAPGTAPSSATHAPGSASLRLAY